MFSRSYTYNKKTLQIITNQGAIRLIQAMQCICCKEKLCDFGRTYSKNVSVKLVRFKAYLKTSELNLLFPEVRIKHFAESRMLLLLTLSMLTVIILGEKIKYHLFRITSLFICFQCRQCAYTCTYFCKRNLMSKISTPEPKGQD